MKILGWPPALGLSLLVIIIGVNRKLHLGLTMFLSSACLLIFTVKAPLGLLDVVYATLTDRSTQILLLSIFILEILGKLLKKTGALQDMITNLGRLIRDRRLLTVALPACIGILTVPGGAIFSAPLVEQAGGKAGLSPERQAAANLWFRHAFYFSYPLFPSVILAAELAGVGVLTFLAYNISLTLAGLLAAYLVIFRGISGKTTVAAAGSDGDIRGLSIYSSLAGVALSMAPMLTVLLLVIAFDLLFPLALAAGLAVALVNGVPLRRGFAAAVKRRLLNIVLPGLSLNLVLVVLGIMFYRQSLIHSGATGLLAVEMLGWGMPPLVLMFIFAALVGLLIGENAASVAIVFPLFLPLLDAAGAFYPAQVAFLYFGSAWSHIFTPTHPCVTLTNAYFKVELPAVLRVLLIPAAATAVVAWAQIILLTNL